MRKAAICIALLTALQTLSVYGDTPPAQEKWLKDQEDQTDTLAIPLDSSEEEEKAEQKELQGKPKQRPQSK